METDHRIVTKEREERDTPRTLPGLLVGAITRTSASLRGASSHARLAPFRRGRRDRGRDPLPQAPSLPNFYLASFLAIVVIPAFICVVYLAFIASDQYVAEARLAVKSAQFEFGSDKASSAPLLSRLRLNSGDRDPGRLHHHQLHPQPRHPRRSRRKDRHPGDLPAARGGFLGSSQIKSLRRGP